MYMVWHAWSDSDLIQHHCHRRGPHILIAITTIIVIVGVVVVTYFFVFNASTGR